MNNEDFFVFKENVDNKKILSAVAKKFRGSLEQDELEVTKDIALWNAIKSYKGGKFTTHLYKNMKWECIKLFRKKKATPKKSPIKHISDIELVDFYDLLTILSIQERSVIDKRLENRTFREIGKEMNLSAERIRQIYKKALLKLRKEVQ